MNNRDAGRAVVEELGGSSGGSSNCPLERNFDLGMPFRAEVIRPHNLLDVFLQNVFSKISLV
jgi:hypothetical protein